MHFAAVIAVVDPAPLTAALCPMIAVTASDRTSPVRGDILETAVWRTACRIIKFTKLYID
jgi:hypothetical protein